MSTDSRRVIWSWALYDFANSPFTTLVVTFVYATYNDALATIFAFGGIYAVETFGFSLAEALLFAIVVNVAAGTGAFAMRY